MKKIIIFQLLTITLVTIVAPRWLARHEESMVIFVTLFQARIQLFSLYNILPVSIINWAHLDWNHLCQQRVVNYQVFERSNCLWVLWDLQSGIKDSFKLWQKIKIVSANVRHFNQSDGHGCGSWGPYLICLTNYSKSFL